MEKQWVSDCCLTPNEQFFSYIIVRTSYIRWDDDDVHFALDQHSKLNFYRASSLKQQSTDRHMDALGHIILIWSQPVLLLRTCSAEKQQIPIYGL
jgi:predicted alpha/beta hydrolase